MRLESALFSSTSSMQSHGKALQVVGDNISNVNTIGYKASSVQFGDLLAEGEESHNSSADPVAGNGVYVKDVVQNYGVGTVEFTDRSLDVAIEGDGFFTVGSVADQQYTRDGSFIIDSVGELALGSGEKVLGYTGATGTSLGTIDMVNLDITGTPTSAVTVSGNLDGSSTPINNIPTNPATFTEVGANADLLTGVTVYDSLGEGHALTIAFYKTDVNTWTARGYMDGSGVGGTEGVPVQVGSDTTLSFGTDGLIATDDQAAAVLTGAPAYSNGAATGSFTVDFSNFSQFSGASVLNTIVQDGQSTGSIDDYEFRPDGTIIAKLTGGTEVLVGSVPVASFTNVEGLNRAGSGTFEASEASGTATQNTAGTSGTGNVTGGALELSNVDLTTEFVDLVVLQRGYQAGSQVFSQASDMIRDTINLIR